MANDSSRRIVLVSVKTDAELYSWIDAVYQRCPSMGGVSNPTNFTHKVHVGFDPVSGGFTGLPDEWEKLLTASAITREDYAKNPQAVIEVLEFYSDIRQRQGQQDAFSSMVPTPPGTSSAQSKQLGMGLQTHPHSDRQMPGQSSQYDSNRDRERRDIEQMERDAYRDREYEKAQRDQQMLREKQERERAERDRAEREREREKEREREREREKQRELAREEQRRQEEEYFNSGEDYGERQRTDQQLSSMLGLLLPHLRPRHPAFLSQPKEPRLPIKRLRGREMILQQTGPHPQCGLRPRLPSNNPTSPAQAISSYRQCWYC
ncbi:P21-Rho-binding domain-containing protein, partial [Kalaharituber pfeilii]